MGNELPEEITNAIKTEANKIYWETHKASIARDPYTRGLTMFEVAQVPLINVLTAKEVKCLELKEQAQAMADALEKALAPNYRNDKGYWVHPNIIDAEILDAVESALQQFKDGISWTEERADNVNCYDNDDEFKEGKEVGDGKA